MSDYSHFSLNQIRHALTIMEHNYSVAMDTKTYGAAKAIRSKIDLLMAELASRLVDPYTAEVEEVESSLLLREKAERYFESNRTM